MTRRRGRANDNNLREIAAEKMTSSRKKHQQKGGSKEKIGMKMITT